MCLVVLVSVMITARVAAYRSLGTVDGRDEAMSRLLPDSEEYYITAVKYARTGRLERPFAAAPETRRPIGYSVILGRLLSLGEQFGLYPVSRTVAVVVASACAVLTGIIVFLTIVSALGSGRMGLAVVATALADLIPANVLLSVTGTVEPAFVLLATTAIAAAIALARLGARAGRRRVVALALLAGVASALAVWTRGNALLLVLATILFGLWLRREGSRHWMRVLIVSTLPVLASVGLQGLALKHSTGRWALPSIGVDTFAHYTVFAGVAWARTRSLIEGQAAASDVGAAFQQRYLRAQDSDEALLNEATRRIVAGISEAPLHVVGRYMINWSQLSDIGPMPSSRYEDYLSRMFMLATLSLLGLCVFCALPGAAVLAMWWLVLSAGAAVTSLQGYRVFSHSELVLAYSWTALPVLWAQRREWLRQPYEYLFPPCAVVGALLAWLAGGGWEQVLIRGVGLFVLMIGLTLIAVAIARPHSSLQPTAD